MTDNGFDPYDTSTWTKTDPNVCDDCGIAIGRAGRTDEELTEAMKSGTFATALGTTDYSVIPFVTTYRCSPCDRKSR